MNSRGSLASSVVLALCVVLAMAIGRVMAQIAPIPNGITVVGIGESPAVPTRVEFATSVSGQGELAADAQAKYRGALKRATTALEALHIDGLEVKGQGFGMGNQINQAQIQMMMRMGMAGQTPASQPSFNVSERLNVTVDHVDKLDPEKLAALMARVMDAIKDAGLKLGESEPTNIYEYQIMQQNRGPSSVQFKLLGPGEARNRAYELAMTDARAKAAKLAELAGVKLGRVTAVTEADLPSNDPQAVMRMVYAGRGPTRGSEISSSTFQPISVGEALTVTFAIDEK